MITQRILIVDDEAVNRRLLEAVLVAEGYDVVEAADGAAGLDIIQREPVDLVLLDVMMPRQSGFEVCARIRNDLGLLHLPVVFVTALGDRDSRIRGKDVGADDFLTKPVDDVELLVRVRSLLRLKAAYDAKERKRRLMMAILENMSEGVVAADETAGITLWNTAAERILGPRSSWSEVDAWPGDHRLVTPAGRTAPAVVAPLALAMNGEATVDQRVRLGDTSRFGRHLIINARPLSATASGRGSVAVFRDVSQLVELDQFKHEMTSLVVHDLKNVMMIIGANVEHALDVGDRHNTELQETLGDARDAAARAIRLIANLMDVARLENSALELKTRPVEPDALCSAATRHRASQLRSRGLGLTIDASALPVDVDAELLGRVLDNILDNAVRYTPAGGRIAITASTTEAGRVRIAIGNTGEPIPPEDRARIFEKYGQAAAAGTGGKLNAGLGLYFCRLAVAAHGGRIWVETSPELATVFVIELPAAEAASTSPGATRTLTMKLAL
jgi:signal transduction histidine kinase